MQAFLEKSFKKFSTFSINNSTLLNLSIIFCTRTHRYVNSWSNVAKSMKTCLKKPKWEVLPHPPYSRDVTPSDYYLFRSMAHGLADQHFRSYKEVKKWINSWIRRSPQKTHHFSENEFGNCLRDGEKT